MKKDIHPKYNRFLASCVCGNQFMTGSVLSEIKLDICSGCHPFFTGTQKILDAEGRVEKFNKRYANVSSKRSQK